MCPITFTKKMERTGQNRQMKQTDREQDGDRKGGGDKGMAEGVKTGRTGWRTAVNQQPLCNS